MDVMKLVSSLQKSLSQLTHINTKLEMGHDKHKRDLGALNKRVTRLSSALHDAEIMRKHMAMIDEKIDILSQQVMTLSELNHTLTQQLHQLVVQPEPTEARDNVTHLKRNV